MKFIYKINVIILSSIIFFSCGNKEVVETKSEIPVNENEVTLTDAQLKNTKITIGKAETKAISSVLKVNGKIDVPPQNMVSISAPLGGYLKNTSLLPGMHVNRGQVLCVLEDQQYIQLQQDFLSSKVKVNVLQKDYNRQRDLNKEQASSDKVMQQAKALLDYEMVTMNSLKQKLQMIGINPSSISVNNISKSISIHSPIDGFVTKVNVNIGKYCTPSEVLFDLVNPTDIHLNLQLFEKDIPSLFIGQQLDCYTPSNPTKKHRCEIILISKDVNENKTVDVHCHFHDYDKTLIPGMYLTAEIETKMNLGLSVPENAVVLFEGKNYIYVAQEK
jgi:cobalt-zinc-cadmium efflux system membrane fusion protein